MTLSAAARARLGMRLNIGRFAETASPDVLVALEQRSIGEIGKSGEKRKHESLGDKPNLLY